MDFSKHPLSVFLSRLLHSFGIFLFCLIFIPGCSQPPETTSFTAMNTFMTVKSYGRNAKNANQEVQKEIERLEKILSTTLEESEIWEINNSESSSFTLSSETAFLLEQSRRFYELSGGAFNPALYPVIREWGFTTENYKVPESGRIQELLELTDFSQVILEGNTVYRPTGLQLDFGAIGKGFAGDRAIELLQQNGIKSALLDFGGNIQVLGSKPDGSAWTVGIKNPWGDETQAGTSSAPVAAVKLRDACMITSGGYERFFITEDGHKYIHLFDSTTGRPVENELESVTIICKQGLYGDALSTSLFVMGKDKAVKFWQNTRNFDFVLLTKNRQLIYSAPLKEVITLLFDFSSVQIIE